MGFGFGWTKSKGVFLEFRPFPIVGPVFGVKLVYVDGSGFSLKPYVGARAEVIPGAEVAAHMDADKQWDVEIGLNVANVASGKGSITGQGRSITGASVDVGLEGSCTLPINEENPSSVASVSQESLSQMNDGIRIISKKRKRNTDDMEDPEPTASKQVCRPAGQSQEKI